MPKLPHALHIRSKTLKARKSMAQAKIAHHREEVRKISDELKQIHGQKEDAIGQLAKELNRE